MNDSGVSVTPSLVKIDLATDANHFDLEYKNTTASPVQINLSAKDFTSLEDGWRVRFLDTINAQNYQYSLSSWITFTPPTLLLKPNESGTTTVAIRDQALSAGGHYASVIADVSDAPANADAIAIKSKLVSLVFVRANSGNEIEAAKIASFSPTNNSWLNLAANYVLRLSNTGNTELVPHGVALLISPLGHTVHQGILNQDSLLSLPESVRRYNISLVPISHAWPIPGIYKTTLTINYGKGHQLTTQFKFFSFGNQLNFILVVVLFLALLRFCSLKMKRR